jgi:uncharacterized protein YbjT (DUF2867 family)
VILVVGGSGRLGTLLVRRLAARGERVRVLTRDPSRAAHLADTAAEIAIGDLRDVGSLERALTGVKTVVSAAHGFGTSDVSPETVDHRGNVALIDAAARAEAEVVLMSGVGASADSPMELFRAKAAAEQHLRSSGVRWTIVRATAFAETWAMVMGDPLRKSGTALVFGRGDNPINFVSVADVAALLELVVLDDRLRGETIEIGGTANVTMNQLARMLARAFARPARARHVPRPMLRAMGLLLRPINPALARHARAALEMDRVDLTFDGAPTRRRFPELTETELGQALASCGRTS